MEDKLNTNKLNMKMRHDMNLAVDEIKQQKSELKKKTEAIARLVSNKCYGVNSKMSFWNLTEIFVQINRKPV